MPGCERYKLESSLLGEISMISDMQMTRNLWQNWRGTKEPLDENERVEWKCWLKSQIKKKKKLRSWILVPCLHGKYMGIQWKQWQTLFTWALKSLQIVTAAMKLKDTAPWKKSYDQYRQHIKKQRHYFAHKCPSSQSYCFSSSYI